MFKLFLKKMLIWLLAVREVSYYLWTKIFYGNKGGIRKEDERNISGFIVIVTGANTGIGKEITYEFAIRKAKVIMACRNLVEGQKAIEDLNKRAKICDIENLDLILIHLDLADFSSVRKFCTQIKNNYSKIDILVNNAGIMDVSGKFIKVKDEFDQHIYVNYLSSFLLTNLLLENIKAFDSGSNDIKTNPGRIINLSSTLHFVGLLVDKNNLLLEKSPKTMGHFNTFPYGLSKLYISLFSKEISRRVNEKQVLIYAMCPGFVDTGLFKSWSWWKLSIINTLRPIFGVSTTSVCNTVLQLTVSRNPPRNGTFQRFSRIHPFFESMIENNKELGKTVWEISENAIGF